MNKNIVKAVAVLRHSITILLTIVAIAVYPWLFMWALNHLFDTGIGYNLMNWVAVVVTTATAYPLIAMWRRK